jgi:hypothetical protein
MDIPGLQFHPLEGERKGEFSVWASWKLADHIRLGGPRRDQRRSGGLPLMPRNNPLMRGIPPQRPGAMLRDIVLPALGKNRTEIAAAAHLAPDAV